VRLVSVGKASGTSRARSEQSAERKEGVASSGIRRRVHALCGVEKPQRLVLGGENALAFRSWWSELEAPASLGLRGPHG
jgi:hypothetical protein